MNFKISAVALLALGVAEASYEIKVPFSQIDKSNVVFVNGNGNGGQETLGSEWEFQENTVVSFRTVRDEYDCNDWAPVATVDIPSVQIINQYRNCKIDVEYTWQDYYLNTETWEELYYGPLTTTVVSQNSPSEHRQVYGLGPECMGTDRYFWTDYYSHDVDSPSGTKTDFWRRDITFNGNIMFALNADMTEEDQSSYFSNFGGNYYYNKGNFVSVTKSDYLPKPNLYAYKYELCRTQ